MSVDFRTRNAQLLAKVETTPGTDASPSPSTDAIRFREMVGYTPNFQQLDENYAQESVSDAPPVIGGGNIGMKIQCWLTGAAAPGTTAPDYATLLKGCAFGETKTSAAVTGTSQAVAAGTVTLAAGASSVDNAYVGMPIDGTSGFFSGQRRWITAYNGTTKVASVTPNWTGSPSGTPTYSIPANALYVPVTLGQKNLSLYSYLHDSVSGNTSRLRKLLAGVGSASISLQPRGYVGIDFNFIGQLPAAPTDVSRPAAATFVGTEPQPYILAASYYNGAAVKFTDYSLDFGNTIAMFDDPSQAYGYDTGEVTRRRMTGRLVPNQAHVSSRDMFSDMLASTSRSLVMAWGNGTGKQVSLYTPAIRPTGNEPGDSNGFATEGVPFRATGADGEVYICVS